MFSRTDFEASCRAFLDEYSHSDDVVFGGWSWNEHAYLPRLGYLSRRTTARASVNAQDHPDEHVNLEGVAEDDATAAATPVTDRLLLVSQFIVYSSTFQVPAFYFSVHTTSGSPVSLDDVLSSSLFRRDAFPDAQKTGFALQAPDHTFPLLSQGEHPTLGTACWFFHPCETPTALIELVRADENADASPRRALELWLLLVGNVINLRH